MSYALWERQMDLSPMCYPFMVAGVTIVKRPMDVVFMFTPERTVPAPKHNVRDTDFLLSCEYPRDVSYTRMRLTTFSICFSGTLVQQLYHIF
jgi:hypothetical protein